MIHPEPRGGIDRLPRLHRVRKVVAWVVLVALSLALISLAFAATRGSSAQGRPVISGGVSYEAFQALHARRDGSSRVVS